MKNLSLLENCYEFVQKIMLHRRVETYKRYIERLVYNLWNFYPVRYAILEEKKSNHFRLEQNFRSNCFLFSNLNSKIACKKYESCNLTMRNLSTHVFKQFLRMFSKSFPISLDKLILSFGLILAIVIFFS